MQSKKICQVLSFSLLALCASASAMNEIKTKTVQLLGEHSGKFIKGGIGLGALTIGYGAGFFSGRKTTKLLQVGDFVYSEEEIKTRFSCFNEKNPLPKNWLEVLKKSFIEQGKQKCLQENSARLIEMGRKEGRSENVKMYVQPLKGFFGKKEEEPLPDSWKDDLQVIPKQVCEFTGLTVLSNKVQGALKSVVINALVKQKQSVLQVFEPDVNKWPANLRTLVIGKFLENKLNKNYVPLEKYLDLQKKLKDLSEKK